MVWEAPPRTFVGEPAFVPRIDSTAEDDGYIFSLLFNAAKSRSTLTALDAQTLQPAFALHLKKPVPFSFHCCWIPWTSIQELTGSKLPLGC